VSCERPSETGAGTQRVSRVRAAEEVR